MKLIIGLGNPGEKYKGTRHNVGHMAIDELKHLEPDFVLAKTDVFMNESGKSVKKLLKYYKVPITSLIIIHDDIDIPVGKLKISENRGSAGHKGVESIIKQLGTKNFKRMRIGIQPKRGKPKVIEKFVLKKFTKEEKKQIKTAIENIII